MAERIGLFGGSFNPPHHGHMIVARALAEHLGLPRIVLLPSAKPPHKDSAGLADGAHRSEMLRLAIHDDPLFSVSDYDLKRSGPCYTIDTVAHFQRQLGPAAVVFWLIGADSLAELPTWHRAAELVDACSIATAVRAGWDQIQWEKLEEAFGADRTDRLRRSLVTSPMIDISSTEIRQRLKAGRPIRYLVPEAVVAYIRQHGLYRDGPPVGGAG